MLSSTILYVQTPLRWVFLYSSSLYSAHGLLVCVWLCAFLHNIILVQNK